eukprot:scaffold33291_cov17-Prasinocladus_malaysianus.AAC.1
MGSVVSSGNSPNNDVAFALADGSSTQAVAGPRYYDDSMHLALAVDMQQSRRHDNAPSRGKNMYS